MQLDEFTKHLEESADARQRFAQALQARISNTGLGRDAPEIAVDVNGDQTLADIVIDPTDSSTETKEALALAGVDTLKDFGVLDVNKDDILDKIASDPKALNVVYKDGGWVVNTRHVDGLGN